MDDRAVWLVIRIGFLEHWAFHCRQAAQASSQILFQRAPTDYREVYSLSLGYGVRCLNILYE